ncbi:hypothetical protein [Streptomyces sp. NPDC048172]|uniref:hypothetical protein n=1 Tax=Streptomyces sp. NPDC048172 TaxID=3365505 RepID=UPI0037175778
MQIDPQFTYKADKLKMYFNDAWSGEGLMGVEPDAPDKTLSTGSRLPSGMDWLQIKDIELGGNTFTLRHNGADKSTLTNTSGPDSYTWEARFPGKHATLKVDGEEREAKTKEINGKTYSYAKPGEVEQLSGLRGHGQGEDQFLQGVRRPPALVAQLGPLPRQSRGERRRRCRVRPPGSPGLPFTGTNGDESHGSTFPACAHKAPCTLHMVLLVGARRRWPWLRGEADTCRCCSTPRGSHRGIAPWPCRTS